LLWDVCGHFFCFIIFLRLCCSDLLQFVPEQYLHELFKTKKMKELVYKDQQLTQQVKTLDSDMQTLVYENYNKFISATDTIRKMKSKV